MIDTKDILEAAQELSDFNYNNSEFSVFYRHGFVDGAKWMKECYKLEDKQDNQQTKESLSTIRSLALQLDRKGVKTLIDEIDKMINEL